MSDSLKEVLTIEHNGLEYIINNCNYTLNTWGRGEVWSSRLPVTQEVAGSNPVVPAFGQIAQSVEHLSEKQGVGSSILPLATN